MLHPAPAPAAIPPAQHTHVLLYYRKQRLQKPAVTTTPTIPHSLYPDSPCHHSTMLPLQDSGKTKSSDAGGRATIAGVGDSLPHDILGALRAQISSVFVAGGVHFKELGVEQGLGGVPSDEAYSAAFSKHLEGEGVPTHAVAAFRW